MAARMPELVVYTRRGCHLCEVLIEELEPLIRGRARLDVRDVDSDEAWRAEYGLRVPVLESEGRILSEFRLDRDAVLACLDGSMDRQPGRPGRL